MKTPTEHLSGLGDPHRMRVLASIDFDDDELRRRLDAISARTARTLDMPIGMATLVLDSALLIVGAEGVDGWIAEAGGHPAEWAFCAHAVATGQPYVVPDAANDPAQADNPLVTIDGVASYAGVPLTVDGEVLGAHCVVGAAARTFTDEDIARLHDAADEIVALLELHRLPTS